MSRRRRAAAAGVFVLLAVTAVGTTSSSPTLTPAAMERTLIEIRASHPATYLVGVIEIVGDGDCRQPGESNACALETKVVTLLDGHLPSGGSFRSRAVRAREPAASAAGQRFLVAAVPMPEGGDTFGWTLALANPTEEDVAAARTALSNAPR